MSSIKFQVLDNDNVHVLGNMCNQLMRFQADNASVRKDIMANMSFNNRFLPDYRNSSCKYVVVAYNGKDAVGFSFATVANVTTESLHLRPDWASGMDGVGFYPDDYDVPKRVGTFKLLYVDDKYRGSDIGRGLSDRTMAWLKSHSNVDDLWVFVANGNEVVGKFYEKYGFRHSHSVFKKFIEAYVLHLKN